MTQNFECRKGGHNISNKPHSPDQYKHHCKISLQSQCFISLGRCVTSYTTFFYEDKRNLEDGVFYERELAKEKGERWFISILGMNLRQQLNNCVWLNQERWALCRVHSRLPYNS